MVRHTRPGPRSVTAGQTLGPSEVGGRRPRLRRSTLPLGLLAGRTPETQRRSGEDDPSGSKIHRGHSDTSSGKDERVTIGKNERCTGRWSVHYSLEDLCLARMHLLDDTQDLHSDLSPSRLTVPLRGPGRPPRRRLLTTSLVGRQVVYVHSLAGVVGPARGLPLGDPRIVVLCLVRRVPPGMSPVHITILSPRLCVVYVFGVCVAVVVSGVPRTLRAVPREVPFVLSSLHPPSNLHWNRHPTTDPLELHSPPVDSYLSVE